MQMIDDTDDPSLRPEAACYFQSHEIVHRPASLHSFWRTQPIQLECYQHILRCNMVHSFPSTLVTILLNLLLCSIWELILPWCHGAHGVVVSHPLSMREALGSIPSVSMSFVWPVSKPWIETFGFPRPGDADDQWSMPMMWHSKCPQSAFCQRAPLAWAARAQIPQLSFCQSCHFDHSWSFLHSKQIEIDTRCSDTACVIFHQATELPWFHCTKLQKHLHSFFVSLIVNYSLRLSL